MNRSRHEGRGVDPRTLVVVLTDALSTFYDKGEIKNRYYNPGNLFSEVHFISPASSEVPAPAIQSLVGDAKLVIHAVGRTYYTTAFLPFGRIASLLRKIDPDVVRAYDPGIRGTLAVWWARRLGIPSVISIHSELDEQRRVERRFVHQVRRWFERYSVQRADAVICISRYVESYARRYGAKRVEVIYNRVYGDQFVPTQLERPVRNSGDSALPVILSVGRLTSEKNQECLIRAVHGLRARLILVGEGPLRGWLEQLVDELLMNDRVTFVPSVPHRDIARYYHDADIFATATRFEGFCIPLLEAMAAGLPVVASHIGPIAEILADTGIVVENDSRAFASALDRLIRDPDLRRDLGRRAADRARTMDGSVMEQREKALYRALCA